jgi:hypothetical protein
MGDALVGQWRELAAEQTNHKTLEVGLRESENRVLRTIFGSKRGEVTGGKVR